MQTWLLNGELQRKLTSAQTEGLVFSPIRCDKVFLNMLMGKSLSVCSGQLLNLPLIA